MRSHRYPVFLPGTGRFLYQISSPDQNTAGIYLGAFDSTHHTRLSGDHSNPAYTEGPDRQGYLLFAREGTLMAQRFDAADAILAGEAFPVAEKVASSAGGRAAFSVSGNGLLVYHPGSADQTQLFWTDRMGKRLETVGEPGDPSFHPSLSPDEKQVAFFLCDPQTRACNIWVRDLSRGVAARLTFQRATDSAPVWSPDGGSIAFTSRRGRSADLYLKSAGGAGRRRTPAAPGQR